MFDIEVLKRKMLVKYPFFGSTISNVSYKEMLEINTAATDGTTIFYNPNYLRSLTIEEQLFTLAHEVCHIAFDHIKRCEGKNIELWNIATDAVDNQLLKKDGLPLPEGVIDIADAINYSAEEMYEILLKEGKENCSKNNENNSSSNNAGNNSKECSNNNEKNNDSKKGSHSMWQESAKKSKDNNGDSTKAENPNKENNKSDEKELNEQEAFKKNRELKKKKLEDLKEKLNDAASKAGTNTDSKSIKFENIGRAKPIVDWRYILRETTKFDVDYSYRNATIENGVLTVNIEEIEVPETEILLDTSDSINEKLLRNFLRECKNIMCYSKIKVGCFDTKFYGFTTIEKEEDIENMTFIGRGGTNFDVAVNAFTKRVDNKIIFTDGEADMPKKSINAIWIVFGGKIINPKGGKVISISDEQYRKLCKLGTEKQLVKRRK